MSRRSCMTVAMRTTGGTFHEIFRGTSSGPLACCVLACSLGAGVLIFLFLTRNSPGTHKSPHRRRPKNLHDDDNDDDGRNVPQNISWNLLRASCVLRACVLSGRLRLDLPLPHRAVRSSKTKVCVYLCFCVFVAGVCVVKNPSLVGGRPQQ